MRKALDEQIASGIAAPKTLSALSAPFAGRRNRSAILLPIPPRSSSPELLDAPHLVRTDLSSNLRDIRRLNRWFGGSVLAVRSTARVLRLVGGHRVLDVCTGSADIPLALLRWAERRGVRIEITASDISSDVLTEARRETVNTPIVVVEADACALPWRDRSFDVALCSLALHHFEPDAAVTVLREMWRVSQRGIVVTDLYRSYAAYAGTWAATRAVARNRVTRHDGPLSVLRAYTPDELLLLARRAGLHDAHIRRAPFFRQRLVALRREPVDAR